MRRVLVALIAVGMAVLSFDALRAYALDGKPLTDGVIPQAAILPRPWLAMLWAIMIDLAAAAGIIGVKDDRGDWRAWLMLLLALGATLGFQVFQFPPMVARAVPPVGLALAILVLDLGPGKPRPERTSDPLPARAHRWLRSWDQVEEVPVARFGPPTGLPGHPHPAPRTPHHTRTPYTGSARAGIVALLDRNPKATIADAIAATGRAQSTVAPLLREEKARRNGNTPAEGVRT